MDRMKTLTRLVWWRRQQPSEFVALLRPHLERLHRAAYRFTGDPHDAEDLVQDLLAKLYPRREELRAVDQLSPWLMRALYRQFVDGRRKRLRSALGRIEPAPQACAAADAMDRFTAPTGSPEEALEAGQFAARVEAALQGMSPEHRAVLSLHDIEGYTLIELERVLDVPLGTLKSRLHRARRQLRGALQGEPSGARLRVSGGGTR